MLCNVKVVVGLRILCVRGCRRSTKYLLYFFLSQQFWDFNNSLGKVHGPLPYAAPGGSIPGISASI